MSTAAQLAREEADAVEAEEAEEAETETETETETAPPPPPDPPPPPTDKAIEKVLTTYYNGVKRVLGEAADALIECPTCVDHLPGFVLELPTPVDELNEDPETKTCPQCGGKGSLKTGAAFGYVETAARMCGMCAGQGFVPKYQTPQAQQTVENGGVPPGYMVADRDQMPTLDSWQRPIGHPHFGIPPSSIGG